jgi:hypothetical protein
VGNFNTTNAVPVPGVVVMVTFSFYDFVCSNVVLLPTSSLVGMTWKYVGVKKPSPYQCTNARDEKVYATVRTLGVSQ